MNVDQKIGADIQVIVTTLNELVGNDTGITPSSDTAVEEQVTNGFNGVSEIKPKAWLDRAGDINDHSLRTHWPVS